MVERESGDVEGEKKKSQGRAESACVVVIDVDGEFSGPEATSVKVRANRKRGSRGSRFDPMLQDLTASHKDIGFRSQDRSRRSWIIIPLAVLLI